MKAIIILFATAMVILFAGISGKRTWLLPLSVLGLLAALVSLLVDAKMPVISYGGMVRFDAFGLAYSGLTVVAATLIFLLSGYFYRGLKSTVADHYGLLLFSLTGALCMFSFEHMVMLFLGIEILSIPLYVMAGSRMDDLKSSEAALKYFLMGAFATGILLFGITLVYGATGAFEITKIQQALDVKKVYSMPLFNTGLLLIMVGLGFKVSAAPFHFWSPDVYEGSPTLVTTFMATIVKTAGFGAFYKLFVMGFGLETSYWSMTMAILAALTMTVGNLSALRQKNMKRMMAYSSISHAGYLMMGLLSGTPGSKGLFLYLVAYVIATIAVFSVFMLVNKDDDIAGGHFSAFSGMGKSNPIAAFILALSMLSLAGIPITAGFFGKFFLFTGAFSTFPWLVGVAVINSAISIYYYFRVIVEMYFNETENPVKYVIPNTYRIVMLFAALTLIGLAFLPEQVLALVP